MSAGSASALAEKADAKVSLRKKLASKILGQDIDQLCVTWYQVGAEHGFEEGVEKTVNDVVTDLLSDAILAVECDVEIMQRVIDIIEH